MYANLNPSMTQTLHRYVNDDVRCALAFDEHLVNRDQCVDCAMASIVVYLCTNAVVTLELRVSSNQMVAMICQPNMRANLHDEYNVDACYEPNQPENERLNCNCIDP